MERYSIQTTAYTETLLNFILKFTNILIYERE